MAKPQNLGSPDDPQMGSGTLHWTDRGEVTIVGDFTRRGYSTLVFDAFTNTTGSPKLLALVRSTLDLTKPTYIARYLVIRLPFRIRSSDRRSFTLGPDGPCIVNIFNPLSIRSDAEWAALASGPLSDLPIGSDPFTWAMVYIGCRRIKDDKLEAITKDTGDLKEYEKVLSPEWAEMQSALASLNRFIVAYWYAAGATIQNNHLRLLSDADMVREPHVWIGCISNSRESVCAIQDEWISFSSTRKPTEPVHLFGERNDLSDATFEKIKTALSKVSDYPALYFSFAGQGYVRNGDYQNALLYYVMAFESAHQHFLEFALSQLGVPEPAARSNDLHMRAGIMTLVKMTLHLFLTASERPSKDAIEKTKKAIELRNSWVHGKRDKHGRLHALQIGRVEISDLIKGVVESTNVLLAILP